MPEEGDNHGILYFHDFVKPIVRVRHLLDIRQLQDHAHRTGVYRASWDRRIPTHVDHSFSKSSHRKICLTAYSNNCKMPLCCHHCLHNTRGFFHHLILRLIENTMVERLAFNVLVLASVSCTVNSAVIFQRNLANISKLMARELLENIILTKCPNLEFLSRKRGLRRLAKCYITNLGARNRGCFTGQEIRDVRRLESLAAT